MKSYHDAAEPIGRGGAIDTGLTTTAARTPGSVASALVTWLFRDQPPPAELPSLDSRFVPMRPIALACRIAASPGVFGRDCGRAPDFLRALDDVVDQEVTCFHAHADELYEALNPDSDTPHATMTARAEDRGERELLTALAYILDKANFETLTDVEVDRAVNASSSYGVRVRVDPGLVEHLTLHVRGHGMTPVTRRLRLRPWKTVTHIEPVYRRLVVVVRLAGETGIRLKLFRDIPVRDVEALLPHAEVEMSALDRIAIYGGGAGALGGVAAKVFAALTTGIVVFSALLWALLGGLAGLALKSFLGYRRTKKLRASQRTHHLYERNLASNAAVLHALLRMIQQEELKEATLAYMLLLSPHTPTDTDEQINQHADAWLTTVTGKPVNFDCPDALRTLDRLGLWADRAQRRVLPIDAAIHTLQRHWRERRTERHHLDALGGGTLHESK